MILFVTLIYTHILIFIWKKHWFLWIQFSTKKSSSMILKIFFIKISSNRNSEFISNYLISGLNLGNSKSFTHHPNTFLTSAKYLSTSLSQSSRHLIFNCFSSERDCLIQHCKWKVSQKKSQSPEDAFLEIRL